MQGAIVFALGAALDGEITLKDGRVLQSNFSDYPALRMTRFRRWRSLSSPPAINIPRNGAGSANPARRPWRRRSAMRFSPRRASASGRCRFPSIV
jgi:hypothetical protein